MRGLIIVGDVHVEDVTELGRALLREAIHVVLAGDTVVDRREFVLRNYHIRLPEADLLPSEDNRKKVHHAHLIPGNPKSPRK